MQEGVRCVTDLILASYESPKPIYLEMEVAREKSKAMAVISFVCLRCLQVIIH